MQIFQQPDQRFFVKHGLEITLEKNMVHRIVLKTSRIECQELFVPDALKSINNVYYSNNREESTPIAIRSKAI